MRYSLFGLLCQLDEVSPHFGCTFRYMIHCLELASLIFLADISNRSVHLVCIESYFLHFLHLWCKIVQFFNLLSVLNLRNKLIDTIKGRFHLVNQVFYFKGLVNCGFNVSRKFMIRVLNETFISETRMIRMLVELVWWSI